MYLFVLWQLGMVYGLKWYCIVVIRLSYNLILVIGYIQEMKSLDLLQLNILFIVNINDRCVYMVIFGVQLLFLGNFCKCLVD